MERQEAKNPGKFVGQLVHTERGEGEGGKERGRERETACTSLKTH